MRKEAVDLILERNPNAFRPKIETHDSKHIKGCHCKKSGCNKKCAGRCTASGPWPMALHGVVYGCMLFHVSGIPTCSMLAGFPLVPC